MVWKRLLTLAALGALCLGCSKGGERVDTKGMPSAAERIKTALKGIADSGELTSAVDGVRMELNDLRKTDAAKADAVDKGLDELSKISAGQSDKIKAKAKEIMDKL